MNYPVWDVFFGSGLLIAIVSVIHVFVAHFAIGGGLFLVVSEKRGYYLNDQSFLDWVARYTRFFVLLTLVLGAVSGVGIWFTIALVHPSGTSTLIRSYVWAWSIEWLFFFLEITAALLYLYGWKTLDRKTHLWIGWVYFWSAFFSMVVINGIITFMLTPGAWLESGTFWDGFLNPTYLPSLGLRFAFSLVLAGVYALLTATREKDRELRSRLISWSARWIVPAFFALPIFAAWYIAKLPPQVWASAQGRTPTPTRYTTLLIWCCAIALAGSLWALFRPRRFPFSAGVVVFAAAFLTMWSFEFVRESVRKPYVICGYMYSNSVLAHSSPSDGGLSLDSIRKRGLLASARWSRYKTAHAASPLEVGHEIFRLQCQSCHTTSHYRGVRQLIRKRNWDEPAIYSRLGSLEKMVNGAMPPFAGTDIERRALAAFLASLNPDIQPESAPRPGQEKTGTKVFEERCSSCHLDTPDDPLFSRLKRRNTTEIYELLGQLDSLNPAMPAFDGSENERKVLANWIGERLEN
ncbi:MAG TPA: c-type cytochrome [Acidobacteriota bacterium]|nr:c-type cytochrome [Acidobacteriota bacterium]